MNKQSPTNDKTFYDHRVIEPYWQDFWERNKLYSPDMKEANKPFGRAQGKPFYNLMMFPYPSAEGLHVGNMYAFTGVDVYGRFKRMQGYDVFEPIGLDGFGIHSENYALKVNRHPKEQAKITEANYYRQLHAIGNGYDWTRTVETYNPDYYKWTQWIFIQMFKAGLAYKAEAPVNWCPSCKTVLADEQVIDGKCERCKSLVEKRHLKQWFFRIATGLRTGKNKGSTYADSLLKNLQTIDWVDKVKVGQKNWIGRKEGINIHYPVVMNEKVESGKWGVEIICFTTRPDTNFGATFIVLGPEHSFVKDILTGKQKTEDRKRKEIEEYVLKSLKKTDEERIGEGGKKTGVFTGFYAINRLNGEELPIWISDFVLGDVGTGAVVGVPGHDIRDFQFATTFGLPIKRVVVGKDGDTGEIVNEEQVQEESGKMINSEFLDGLDIHEATKKIMDYIEEKGWGERVVHYHLRDWLISRQRYWGAPIPMVYCKTCAEQGITSESRIKNQESRNENNIHDSLFMIHNSDLMAGWFPVSDDQLPVELPDVKDWKPTGTGKAPLASVPSFVKTKCPNCGGSAERETDVCDTFLDSSWYHLRYPFVGYDSIPFGFSGEKGEGNGSSESREQRAESRKIMKKWLPVTSYIGGAEHTVLHLLYARFVSMVLHDLGYIDFDEPYTRFYAHGLIIKDGAKMSKSKGNVVVPDEYITSYGSDTLRTYLMFLGPFDAGGDFRDSGIAGMYKFTRRVWRLVSEWIESVGVGLSDPKANRNAAVEAGAKTAPLRNDLNRFMHKTIKEVTEDMENLRYNTAIAHIMEYVNAISSFEFPISNEQGREIYKTLLLLLAPFMPHMTEELWAKIQTTNNKQQTTKENSIHFVKWPVFDPELVVEEVVTIVVQINGKTRETITMQNDECKMQNIVEEKALALDKVVKHLEGKPIRKTIFVPGRLINFVV